jgi:hypothetical protein
LRSASAREWCLACPSNLIQRSAENLSVIMKQIFWQAPYPCEININHHPDLQLCIVRCGRMLLASPILSGSHPHPCQHLLSVAGKLIATDLPQLVINRHPASTAIRHEVLRSDRPNVLRITKNPPKRKKRFPASVCIICLTACMSNTSLVCKTQVHYAQEPNSQPRNF